MWIILHGALLDPDFYVVIPTVEDAFFTVFLGNYCNSLRVNVPVITQKLYITLV